MSPKDVIKKSKQYKLAMDTIRRIYYKYLTTDEQLIRRKFRKRLGRELNLKNPKYFNDKLQWLKLNWNSDLAVQCADKYAVRKYIKDSIGEKYLNNLYAVYDSVEEIDIKKLPKSFVLKGTHGSGFNIICKDKNEIDWHEAFKTMRKWLKTNYYLQNREWVYKDINPRIICEAYLEEPDSGQLKDYKLHCFNGEPKIIQVDFDRYEGHKKNMYDLEWNLQEVEYNYPYDKDVVIKKPKKFNELIELSRILSKEFSYARIDFYIIKEKIIFGEITFFPASGMGKFVPIEFEEKMGEWLKLGNDSSPQ